MIYNKGEISIEKIQKARQVLICLEKCGERNNSYHLKKPSQLIDNATCAIIGVIGDEGYPYTFPISHALDKEGEKIYFHSARAGHKIDAIRKEPKVSFSVVGKDDVISAEYTTYFKSAQGFRKSLHRRGQR